MAILAAAGAWAWPAAASAQPQRASVSAVFPLLGAYLTLPSALRSLFYFAYRPVRRGRTDFNVRARLAAGGTTAPLALDRLGFVARLPTLAEIHAGAQVEFDGDPLRFQIEARAAQAPLARLEAAPIAAALAQINDDAYRLLGHFNIFVPKMTSAFFPESLGGRALFPDGRSESLPLFRTGLDGPTPYFEQAMFEGASHLALDQAPTRITLGIPRSLNLGQ